MPVRHTYRAVLAYDGRRFFGFAKQPGLRTVEATLLDALRPHLPALPAIQVGGRTDKGVHAVGQVVSFYGPQRVDPALLFQAIDEADPEGLAALDVRAISRSFHAQYSAEARWYSYVLRWPSESVEGRCSARALDRLVRELVGTRCFRAFARRSIPGKSTVKRLMHASARALQVEGEDGIQFDFVGRSFLRGQVRIMVATALREAIAGAPDHALLDIANGSGRPAARPAPAEGLYLRAVSYPPVHTDRRPNRARPSSLATSVPVRWNGP